MSVDVDGRMSLLAILDGVMAHQVKQAVPGVSSEVAIGAVQRARRGRASEVPTAENALDLIEDAVTNARNTAWEE